MRKFIGYLSAFFAIVLSLFHLYTGAKGSFDPWTQRVIHLGLGFVITFFTYPMMKGKKINILDILLALISIAAGLYVIIYMDAIIDRSGMPNKWDVFFGVVTLILVLEMTRRVIGLPLVIVSLVFLLYAYFGQYFPEPLAHRGYDFERISAHMYTTLEGIYGVPIGVSASYVILFVIYGAFLEATKTGDFFINIANSIAGKAQGGPAKVAVISSALFGTISGSAVANVVSTGTYTIPLMKRTGYKSHFAAAVEAVASSGGQLMPPVMGAAAFVISEMTGVSYLKICLAATIPAILYYVGVFVAVHMEAKRIGLKGLSAEEVPPFWGTLKSQGYLALSAGVLIYFLAVKLTSPSFAVFWAIIASLILSAIKKDTRLNFKTFLKALEIGAKGSISVIAACACAGIVVGVVTLTGLGLKFSSAILALAHGNVYLTLIYTMIASLILGMGLPTTAAYIICAILAVPALTNLGINPLGAHLFVFYFAIISAITPPVALAAYAAAGIADTDPMKTGFTACRIGLASFIVPYMFVLNPVVLMEGSVMYISWATFTALIGTSILGCAAIGWFFTHLSIPNRALLFISSLLLIHTGVITDLIAFGLIIPVVFMQIKKGKNSINNVCSESVNI